VKQPLTELRKNRIMSEKTSRTLIERLCNQDDNDAWEQFERLYGRLIRHALSKSNLSKENIDDLAQNVRIIALQRLPEFQHNGRTGALRSWLRRVAVFQLRSFQRKQRRQPAAAGGDEYVEVADQLDDPGSPLTHLWREEFASIVLEKVERHFGETNREILWRRTVMKEPVKQTAEALGLTEVAVRNRQSRTLRFLRNAGFEL
jgi:RNA polymerase sigma factor (sigma-70 family)